MINFPTVGTNFVQMNFFFCVEKCLVFESSVCFSFGLLTFHKWQQTLVTGNKLHYADLPITCSNHQRCKDDYCHALMTLTAIGKFQLSQLVVVKLRLLLLTPLWVGCHTLWPYMITNYFWAINNLRETRIQNLLGILGLLYYIGGNKQFKFAGLKIKLTK